MKISDKQGSVFIEISPAKDKIVCSNCNYFSRFGVVSGLCLRSTTKRGSLVMNERDTCKGFTGNELKTKVNND